MGSFGSPAGLDPNGMSSIVKLVCVEIEENGKKYELSFEPSKNVPDLRMLELSLSKKSVELQMLSTQKRLAFRKRGLFFPDTWVDCGELSPLEDKVFLKCVIIAAHKVLMPGSSCMTDNQVHILGDLSASHQVTDSPLKDQTGNRSSHQEAAMSSASSASQTDRSKRNQEIESTPKSSRAASLPKRPRIDCSPVHPNSLDDAGDEHQCDRSMAPSADSQRRTKTRNNPLASSQRRSDGHVQVQSCAAEFAGGVRAPVSRRICLANFKLPSTFGVVLDEKLSEKYPLTFTQYSQLCRVLKQSIEMHTYAPDTDSLRLVVSKLFAKFPHLILFQGDAPTHEDQQASEKFMVFKLQSIFSRLRHKVKKPLSLKGGRPKNGRPIDDDQFSPGVEDFSETRVDMVSYLENVKKLLQLIDDSENTNVIDCLWKSTYEGRRHEIVSGTLSNPQDIIASRCPLLKQPKYLCGELDFILDGGTCNQIRSRWLECVPHIIDYGREHGGVNVRSVLGSYREEDLAESFEIRSSAALDLLPLLIPGRKKNSEVRRSFYDNREDSAGLQEAIKKPVRASPFILKIGPTFTIVIDSKPFTQVSTGSLEALVNLISCYYVFNICWCPDVEPTCLFLQSYLLSQPNRKSEACNSLKVFVKAIKSKIAAAAAEADSD